MASIAPYKEDLFQTRLGRKPTDLNCLPPVYHFSVWEVLPRMLGILDAPGVRVTYFAESWSLLIYADPGCGPTAP